MCEKCDFLMNNPDSDSAVSLAVILVSPTKDQMLECLSALQSLIDNQYKELEKNPDKVIKMLIPDGVAIFNLEFMTKDDLDESKTKDRARVSQYPFGTPRSNFSSN